YYTAYAIKCFRTYLCMMILATVNKATFIYLQSIGKAMMSSVLSLIREVVFGVGLTLILPLFFELDGVLYSMPASDILTFVIALVMISHTLKELSAPAKQPLRESAADEEAVFPIGSEHNFRIITISREFGSGGHSIGKALAEELGIACYDKELIKAVASRTGFDEAYVEARGENAAINPEGRYLNYSEGTISPSDQLWDAQKKVILELAQKEPCVIIGRCADFVLKDRNDVFNVFIGADRTYREQRILKVYGETDVPISKRVRERDTARARNYKLRTGQEWNQADHYDLALNTKIFSKEDCVRIISDAYKA
ncbi:MAG: cytidylate kinase family protein, partial [Eubacteriales bacterium]|nr:cytidylate kinase family protein [Eubacteriales bacterium]